MPGEDVKLSVGFGLDDLEEFLQGGGAVDALKEQIRIMVIRVERQEKVAHVPSPDHAQAFALLHDGLIDPAQKVGPEDGRGRVGDGFHQAGKVVNSPHQGLLPAVAEEPHRGVMIAFIELEMVGNRADMLVAFHPAGLLAVRFEPSGFLARAEHHIPGEPFRAAPFQGFEGKEVVLRRKPSGEVDQFSHERLPVVFKGPRGGVRTPIERAPP